MTAHRWSAVAVAAASFVACSAARGGGPPVVDGPFVSGNLAVYVIHGPARPAPHGYLTLKEGLAAGTVRVHEVQQVNQLEVENSSDQDLFLQAGEIVKGGQQDRTLARDLIVSAHSGRVPIDAHCVEHGRWTQRGGESVALFQSSENSLATKELRRANLAGDQEGVWADVARTQQKLATTEPAVAMAAGTQHDNIATGRQASAGGRGGGGGGGALDVTDSVLLPSAGDDTTVGANTSLQITLENKAVQGRATECLKRLPATGAAGADVVGYAFAVNGKLDGGDVYASHALLAKMYPKLLNAAALEAVIDHPAATGSGDGPTPPSAAAVAAVLAAVDAAAPKPIDDNGRVRLLVDQRNADVATQSNGATDGQGTANAPALALATAAQAPQPATAPAAANVAAASPSPTTAPTVDRAVVVSRSTEQVDEYETRDTAVAAEPFLHRTYLTK
jgi:hypothetical protein